MNDCENYLEVLDEIEKIEEIITPPKYRRCCHSLLDLVKVLFMYMKFKSN